MAYTLNPTQRRSLEIIGSSKKLMTGKLSGEVGLTKGIVCRNIRDLLEMAAIKKEGDVMTLSDFGKILVL